MCVKNTERMNTTKGQTNVGEKLTLLYLEVEKNFPIIKFWFDTLKSSTSITRV